MDIDAKAQRLNTILRRCDRLMVAFSGGTDSTFLLASAQAALKDRVLAVTAESPLQPQREKAHAIATARKLGAQHILIRSRALSLPAFVANPVDRCYICKRRLFEDLRQKARQLGVTDIAHGANCDDLQDYRPGFKAAQEMGILAPLIEAELSKDEIRRLSRAMGLDTWDKPAMACLVSRIPYGRTITVDALRRIEAAESVLYDMGFAACRVRVHDDVARIEVGPEAFGRLMAPQRRNQIVAAFRRLGFRQIAMDLEGYRQGSMNRGIGSTESDPK
jgi:uncharacterized protein